jgi:hypothetical protein
MTLKKFLIILIVCLAIALMVFTFLAVRSCGAF